MDTKLNSQKPNLDNSQDAEVVSGDRSPLNPTPNSTPTPTQRFEWMNTAPKRALSAQLLHSVATLKNRPDGKIDVEQLVKVTNSIATIDKSIREDAKHNNDLLPKTGVVKTLSKPDTKKDDHTRLRVLSELCDITADIRPEDYDLEKLEALIREEEQNKAETQNKQGART